MRSLRVASVTLLMLGITACYHATIDTGLTPNGQTISKAWASGWIYGLVPPSTVETMAKCPTGVAKVETQLSFANQLVNFLTVGIYSPMTIQVHCAAPKSAMGETVKVPAGSSASEKTDAVNKAVERSKESGDPVYLQFL